MWSLLWSGEYPQQEWRLLWSGVESGSDGTYRCWWLSATTSYWGQNRLYLLSTQLFIVDWSVEYFIVIRKRGLSTRANHLVFSGLFKESISKLQKQSPFFFYRGHMPCCSLKNSTFIPTQSIYWFFSSWSWFNYLRCQRIIILDIVQRWLVPDLKVTYITFVHCGSKMKKDWDIGFC